LAGLHQVVPGEFFTAATRPPGVYRGNPLLSKLPSHTEVLSLQEKSHWKHSRNLRLKVMHGAFANSLQPHLVVLAQKQLTKF
jgi:hypothetical protein